MYITFNQKNRILELKFFYFLISDSQHVFGSLGLHCRNYNELTLYLFLKIIGRSKVLTYRINVGQVIQEVPLTKEHRHLATAKSSLSNRFYIRLKYVKLKENLLNLKTFFFVSKIRYLLFHLSYSS